MQLFYYYKFKLQFINYQNCKFAMVANHILSICHIKLNYSVSIIRTASQCKNFFISYVWLLTIYYHNANIKLNYSLLITKTASLLYEFCHGCQPYIISIKILRIGQNYQEEKEMKILSWVGGFGLIKGAICVGPSKDGRYMKCTSST